jgi:hypothetical protein
MSGVGPPAKSDFVRKGQTASENLLYDRAAQIPCVCVFIAQEFQTKWCMHEFTLRSRGIESGSREAGEKAFVLQVCSPAWMNSQLDVFAVPELI